MLDLVVALFDQDHDCAHNMIPLYVQVEAIIAARESAAIEAFRAKAVEQLNRQAADYKAEDEAEGCDSRYCAGWLLGQTHAAQVVRALDTT